MLTRAVEAHLPPSRTRALGTLNSPNKARPEHTADPTTGTSTDLPLDSSGNDKGPRPYERRELKRERWMHARMSRLCLTQTALFFFRKATRQFAAGRRQADSIVSMWLERFFSESFQEFRLRRCFFFALVLVWFSYASGSLRGNYVFHCVRSEDPLRL